MPSEPPRRWIGIDEAGYGPNLGPLVMTALVAEGTGTGRPDFWRDLGDRVCRAGGPSDRLWIDDSKRITSATHGLGRLRDATLATIAATGSIRPHDDPSLLGCLGAGDLDSTEMGLWAGDGGLTIFRDQPGPVVPLAAKRWRIKTVLSRVIGPRRFNQLLAQFDNKAAVHAHVFLDLLANAWDRDYPGVTDALGDKHGGRHAYQPMLIEGFPGVWIERGVEGPASSRYRLRERNNSELTLELKPKADRDDGLVALASIVSKYLRERWMAAFNAYWTARVPGLRPTAGYPVDARRFREAIEAEARTLGWEPANWWRER